MNRPTIVETLETHQDALLALPGVVMVYEGAGDDGAPCIKLAVSAENEELRTRLPRLLEGYPVKIVVTGEIGPRRPEGSGSGESP